MKIFNIIFTVIAVALIIFNATNINIDTPFEGDSLTAISTIIAGLCGIMVMQILMISRRIAKKSKEHN